MIIKNFIFLFFLIGFFSILNADNKHKKIKWKKFTVTLSEKKTKEIDSPIIELELIIKDKKNKIVFSKDYGEQFSIAGFYRTKEEEFLHISGFSGGESGCCSNDEFFYIVGNKVKSINFEQLAYGPFTIVDLDKDKDEEFMIYNSSYYGYSLDDKNLPVGEGKCSIETLGLYLSGYHEVVFPIYRILKKNSTNEYESFDVTFESKYRKALKPYFTKAEKVLMDSKGKTFGSDDYFQGFLQYYYYMNKIGKEKEALAKIKESSIKLKLVCEENYKKKDSEYLLYDIIKINGKKILSESKENPF